jgi:hypothetical protein
VHVVGRNDIDLLFLGAAGREEKRGDEGRHHDSRKVFHGVQRLM